jgi:hypothetical protein
MKALRSTRLRLTSALLFAAAMVALPGVSAADPSDPVCIMPPEDYCTYMEGHTVGTPQFRECYRRASAQHYGEYCNPIEPSALAKLD